MGLTELRKGELPDLGRGIFQTLFENSLDAILLLDSNHFIDCNPATAREFRTTKAEMLNLRPDQISPPVQPDGRDSLEKAAEMMRVAFEKGSHTFEWVHRRSDGEDFYAEVSLTRIPYDNEPVLFSVVRDITDRKRAETAIEQSEELYRVLFNTQQDGIFMIREGRFLVVNQRIEEMTGYSQTELIGMPFLDLVAPEDQQMMAENYRLRVSGRPVLGDYMLHLLHKDQTTIVPVLLRASDSSYQGDLVVVGSLHNVTDSLLAEAELLRSREQLTVLMNNAPVIMLSFNPEGIITMAGGRGLLEMGMNADEMIGKSVFDFYSDVPEIIEYQKQALAGEKVQVEMQIGPNWYEITFSPMHDASGKFVGSIGLTTNITERRQIDQQRQEALVRRGYQVQVSTEIAQEIASASQLSELIAKVVNMVKERFGYYHTQLFRYDPAVNAVMLQYGYGETGQQMLAARHQMDLGRGLVGLAAATGQTVLRSDTTADIDWRSNPLLPETRGEIAVPIKYGERVLGVLDVQSNQTGALTDDDRLLLEGLCGQVAIAIEGTTLRQGLEDRLNELNTLYRANSEDGWRQYREAVNVPSGFVFERGDIHQAEDVWVDEIEQAVQKNQLTQGQSEGATVAPLSVRGEIIGALGIYEDAAHPLSDPELQLIEQVSDQVALALESARLFEQTRLALGETEEQAHRMSELNELSDAINRSGDIFDAMTLACQKAQEILRCDRTSVALVDPSGDTFEVYALTGLQTVVPQGRHLPLMGTAIGKVVSESRVLKIPEDGAAEDFLDARQFVAMGIQTMINVPLITGSQVVGSFNAASVNRAAFDERDRDLLVQLAAILASFIENRRLFERVQGALVATEKQYSFTRRLAEARDLHEVLVDIVDGLGVSEISRAILYTFDFNPQGELSLVTVRSNWSHEGGLGNEAFEVGTQILDDQARSIFGRLLIDAPLFVDETYADMQNLGIASEVILPLWVGSRQIGAIALHADRQHTFTDDEKRPGANLTQQAAIAIESRLLFEEIENQRRNLQAVLDNMPAGVFMVEAPSGHPILTNKRAEEFLGRGISPQAMGENLNELYQAYRYGTDELYPPEEMPVTAGMLGEAKTISDMEVRRPDGARLLLEVSGTPVYDQEGKVIASLVVFIDITERHRLEETILEDRAQLSDALDAARMVNWEYDVENGNFIFNDRFYEFLGTSIEIEGSYLMPAQEYAERFVYPEDAWVVATKVQEAIDTDDPNYTYAEVSRVKLVDGQVLEVMVRSRIEKDAQGRTVRLYGANQDVTAQRQAERTIAKRAAELATVSQVSTTVASILNPDEMLQTVVDLTKARFDLYHAHVYLVDEQGERLVLARGAGEVGRQMVAEGRSIDMDSAQSLVALAARNRQGVMVNDVRENPDFLPHPLLPETRSEMAVPLVVGDTILGVMDIQSDQVDRFSQEDISIMTTLSAQVAVSLQNARSYARAQRQAEREAMINAISERIQSTSSVEAALQVAVRELGRALGAQHTAIRLGLERKNNG